METLIRVKVDAKGIIETEYPPALQGTISRQQYKTFICSMNRHRFGQGHFFGWTVVPLAFFSFFPLAAYFATGNMISLIIMCILLGLALLCTIFALFVLPKLRSSSQATSRHIMQVCRHAQCVFPQTVWTFEELTEGTNENIHICILVPQKQQFTIPTNGLPTYIISSDEKPPPYQAASSSFTPSIYHP
jgi:hypothetical protein